MFTTRKITYIATLTTASVAIILLLSSLTPIAIYPTIRIAFEGVLIKLTGYLFGPIFGMITALITEFLLILFKPGIVHWSYTLVVVLYGLFGGISYYIRKKCKNPVRVSVIALIIVLIGTIVMAAVVGTYFLPTGDKTFTFLGIPLTKNLIIGYFATFAGLTLVFLYLGYLYTSSSKTWAIWFLNALPILLLCLLTELTSIFITPYGDSQVITSGAKEGYLFWMLISFIQSPIRFVFNVVIIYNGWKILSPLVKIDEKPDFLKNISRKENKQNLKEQKKQEKKETKTKLHTSQQIVAANCANTTKNASDS